MNKEQFLAMSLPHGLYLGQHRCGKVEPYLFYGMKHVRCVDKISCYIDDSRHGDYQNSWIEGIYPILYHISDLTKDEWIEKLNAFACNLLDAAHVYDEKNIIGLNWMTQPFEIVIWLIEYHFDVAGLIDKGEAIDVNTLPDNPYK